VRSVGARSQYCCFAWTRLEAQHFWELLRIQSCSNDR
jgi:hypothetical protein